MSIRTTRTDPPEPTFHGHTLAAAIDVLKAHDDGPADSVAGSRDEDLRAWVRRRLDVEMSCRESHEFLARYAREMLSEERIAEGYGLEDVRALVGWLEENT
jgi:hypothetical protein